jgi:hypothetical protein
VDRPPLSVYRFDRSTSGKTVDGETRTEDGYPKSLMGLRVNDCVDSLVMLFDWDVGQNLERKADPNLSGGWRKHREEAIVIAGTAP